MRNLIRRIMLREKADSQSFVSYLRKRGVAVGENVTFYSPRHTLVDMTCPWLIEIGDNVKITHGVIIITHDYSWAVLKRFQRSKGAVLGAQSPVVIGNNVFIGMNAVITRGVTIGDNTVIGTGSVVTSDCDSDSVYAGNPARKIMSLEQFLEKRKSRQLEEARGLVKMYRKRFHCDPPQSELREYFMLFCDLETAKEDPVFCPTMKCCNNYEDSVQYMREHKPLFDSYESFLRACNRGEKIVSADIAHQMARK